VRDSTGKDEDVGSTMKRSAAAVVAAFALGCGGSTEPTVDLEASLLAAPTEIVLGYGEEKSVGGTALRVAFTGVGEDSRCPIDAVCVWQGNAAAELRVSDGRGAPAAIELNTTLEPQAAETHGVRLTLLEVQPAPRAGVPTEPASYTVKVRVEPAR
jgi:hypothetical protein